jgi:hypothetical protein
MPAAEVRSTTGTAPLRFVRASYGLVHVELEDGSRQVYRWHQLLAAVQACAPPVDETVEPWERL